MIAVNIFTFIYSFQFEREGKSASLRVRYIIQTGNIFIGLPERLTPLDIMKVPIDESSTLLNPLLYEGF